MAFTTITVVYILMYILHQAWILFLNRVDVQYLRAHGTESLPSAGDEVSQAEHARRIQYNIDAKNFGFLSILFDIPVHWFFILAGFAYFDGFVRSFGFGPYISGLLFIGLFSMLQMILSLPFSLYHDFVLEERYGFNKKTLSLFVSDTVKSLVIGALLGAPLLLTVFYLMDQAGRFWWIYAFAVIALFQLVVMWLYPTLIAPLFNTFTPLQGPLADAIHELARRIGFTARGIFTMDGSKRSGHSNAYFTGIGRARRIVFFDTILDQMNDQEIIAVLGHEMGHFKLGHIRKLLTLTLTSLFLFLGFLAILKEIPMLYPSLGFPVPSDYAALIIFSMLLEEFLFPFHFLFNKLSRRNEFAADSFSARITGDAQSLISALQKTSRENMASPAVHPWYAAYYYSHPDLQDRISALHALNSGAESTSGMMAGGVLREAYHPD